MDVINEKFEDVKQSVNKVLSEMFEVLNTRKPNNDNVAGYIAECILDEDEAFKDGNEPYQLTPENVELIKEYYIEYFETSRPAPTERQKLNIAIMEYLSGDSDTVFMVEYNKLLKAKADGNGKDYACHYTNIYEPFEFDSVDKILELIEEKKTSL